MAPPPSGAGVPVVWAKHDHSFDAKLARPLGRLATRVVTTAAQVGGSTGRDDLVVIPPPRPVEPLPGRTCPATPGGAGPVGGDGRPGTGHAHPAHPVQGVDTAIEALADPEPSTGGWW